jgi:hypothetical protein
LLDALDGLLMKRQSLRGQLLRKLGLRPAMLPPQVHYRLTDFDIVPHGNKST